MVGGTKQRADLRDQPMINFPRPSSTSTMRHAASRELLLREAREHAERMLERGVAEARTEAREAIAKAEISQERAWALLEQMQSPSSSSPTSKKSSRLW